MNATVKSVWGETALTSKPRTNGTIATTARLPPAKLGTTNLTVTSLYKHSPSPIIPADYGTGLSKGFGTFRTHQIVRIRTLPGCVSLPARTKTGVSSR